MKKKRIKVVVTYRSQNESERKKNVTKAVENLIKKEIKKSSVT